MKKTDGTRLQVLWGIIGTLTLFPVIFMILFHVDFNRDGLFYIYVAPVLMFLGVLYFKIEWILLGIPVIAAILGISWAMLVTRRFMIFIIPLVVPISVYCFVGFLTWALRNG